MSIISEAIWAPAPTTERGKPTQLSASPDGKRLAYASNKSIFIREIDNPWASRQYTEHNATTTVARFSPSGYYVASGDSTGTVRVWDCVGEGATKGEYQLCRSINDLGWDGDSQRIIAVGDGKERFGHCITADSGNTVGEITGQSAQINCVAVKLNRPFRAATGSDDTSLAFYHGAPYKFQTTTRKHNRYVYGAQFSPDGTLLVSVGADSNIWLYDGKTGEPKNQVGAGEHKGSIFSVSWAQDSKQFVTAGADQTVKIWDAESGKCTHTWRLGDEGVVSVPHHQVGVVWTARPDNLIISLSLSGDLTYFTPGSDKPTKIVQAHQSAITAIAPSNGASTFFTGDSDGRVCQWESSGAGAEVEGARPTNYVAGLSVGSSGQVTAVSWDDKLRLISAGTFTGSEGAATEGSPRGAATAGTTGHTVVATHKGLAVFKGDSQVCWQPTSFSSTCIAATSDLVVAGGDDSGLHIFSLSGGGTTLAPQKTLANQASQVTTLAFSPDASQLAIGFASGKITVLGVGSWDPQITRWSAHTARIASIAWTLDGKWAASASLDCSVRVWSVDKPGTRIQALMAHKEASSGVAWLDEPKAGKCRLASTGADAAVKVWRVELK